MSTSIQEQDLIQTIKELKQRVSDLERQQRTLGNNFVQTDPNIPPSINIKDISGDSSEIFPARIRVIDKITDTEQQFTQLTPISMQYLYTNNDDPNLQVGGGINIAFGVDGMIIFNTGDFAPGNFTLIDLSLVLDSHGVNIPTTSNDTGIKGQIKWDNTHLYLCTDTDTWRRVAIGTF
jgi:hypothetical protein